MDLVFIFSRLFKWFCISIEEVSHLNVKNKKIEKSMLRIIARKNTFDNKLTFGAIVLTIIIAISLITGLFLIQIGNRTAEQKVLSQMQQVSIANLTTSKIEELQKNKLIEELVPYKSGFEILIDNKKIQAVYMPNNTEVIHTYRILKGNAPIDKNEVVINENLLQLLNKEIGDELEVSNNDGIFEKFIITGICENVSSTGSFFYVSQRYAEEGKLFTEIPYMALIRINNAEIMNIVEFENTIYDMADKYDIDRKEIYFNSKFLGSLGDESSFGMTFIYITHDQEEALTMSDRIAVMHQGHFEQIGTAKEIYENPQTKFVASFIGESNIFEANVDTIEGTDLGLTMENGKVRAKGEGFVKEEIVYISVRPENTHLSDKPVDGFTLKGIVKDQIYVGSVLKTIVELPNGKEVKVNNHPDATVYPDGTAVSVYWEPDKAVVIHTKEDKMYDAIEDAVLK